MTVSLHISTSSLLYRMSVDVVVVVVVVVVICGCVLAMYTYATT